MTKKSLNSYDIKHITRIVDKLFKPLGLIQCFSTMFFDKPQIKEIEYHDTIYFFSKEEYKDIFIESNFKEENNYYEYSLFFNGENWVFTWNEYQQATRYEPDNIEVKESIEHKYFHEALKNFIHFVLNIHLDNLATVHFETIGE